MHRHHHRRTKKQRVLIAAVAAAMVYLAVMAGILLLGPKTEPVREETRGSLEGRFQTVPEISMEGRAYRYRRGEVVNYLILGVDRPEMGDSAYGTSTQADFLMLLSVDKVHKTITPVMIDRDTMTEVPVYGVFGDPAGTTRMQICLAQGFTGTKMQGSANTAEAVSMLLNGIPVDYYVTLDMAGIALLNDALGGVTVTVEEDMTALDPALARGATVQLNGEQAELFVRSRQTVADGTNESRMKRQKLYLSAMVDAFSERIQGDATALETLLETLEGHLDSDMKRVQMLSAVNNYGKYEHKPIYAISGIHRIGDDGFMEFYPDAEEIKALLIEICYE